MNHVEMMQLAEARSSQERVKPTVGAVVVTVMGLAYHTADWQNKSQRPAVPRLTACCGEVRTKTEMMKLAEA